MILRAERTNLLLLSANHFVHDTERLICLRASATLHLSVSSLCLLDQFSRWYGIVGTRYVSCLSPAAILSSGLAALLRSWFRWSLRSQHGPLVVLGFACPVPSSISNSILYSIVGAFSALRPLAVVSRTVTQLHSTVSASASSGPSGPPRSSRSFIFRLRPLVK